MAGFNSTYDFDNFTERVVNVRLCEKYNLSKGKSLDKFINEEDDYIVTKLLEMILRNYELNCRNEIDPVIGNTDYKTLYAKCQDIICKAKKETSPNVAYLKKEFNDKYIDLQIELMTEMINRSPTDAIGKAKELIEACSWTILDACKKAPDKKYPTVQKLAYTAINETNLTKYILQEFSADQEEIKKVLGSLNQIVTCLGKLRDNYGTGHGKVRGFEPLFKFEANLAVSSSVAFVRYIWGKYKEMQKK